MHQLLNLYRSEFSDYSGATFRKDLFAGLTVAAVALPLALAFGVASGSSAAAGVVTAILAGLIIGALSGAPYQISGPTGAMSAVLIVLAQRYGLEAVWISGTLSGVLLLLLGALRLGRFIAFIPAPVITGFTSGIAVIIAVGQLDNLFGLQSSSADSALVKLAHVIEALSSHAINFHALGIGLFVVTLMLCWPSRWNSLVPASLIAIVIATGAEMLFTWPIATIQDIPSTLVLDERLRIAAFHWDTIQHLIVPTLSITALGAIESLLCGSVGGRMTGKRLHANQELVAQGVGNIVIPFFGGVPATAAIARSSVGIRSGGVTRMVSIVHALALLLAMLCFGALISKVPLAALAGVLIVTAFRMNEWHTIRFYLSRRFAAAISQFAITLIATVSLDLTYAILIGFSISALMFLSQASQLTVTVSDVEVARLKKSHTSFDPDADFSGVKVAYLTGPLFFAATGHLHEALSGLQEPRHLILSMRGVPLIDSSGLEAISELSARMALHGGKVIFAGLNPPVSKMLTQGGVINGEHDPHVFWSAGEAIAGTSSL